MNWGEPHKAQRRTVGGHNLASTQPTCDHLQLQRASHLSAMQWQIGICNQHTLLTGQMRSIEHRRRCASTSYASRWKGGWGGCYCHTATSGAMGGILSLRVIRKQILAAPFLLPSLCIIQQLTPYRMAILSWSLQILVALSSSLLLSSPVACTLTNRTIDDYWGDSVTGVLPVYSVNWHYGPTCTVCGVRPIFSEAFHNTWHDTTSSNPNTTGHYVTLSFTGAEALVTVSIVYDTNKAASSSPGTAIWSYVILANSAPASSTSIFTNVTFELDDVFAGFYEHVPLPTASEFEYNVTAFSKTGLDNKDHSLVMTAAQGSMPSLLLFDWAMYT